MSQSDQFETTHWTLVLAARGPATPQSRAALAALCASYWYPLYAYVRRQGHAPEAAEDLVQEFFARLLETDGLGGADPARGRFRAYLLGACRHFLSNQLDRDRALKRGGDRALLSIDTADAERRYTHEPAHTVTPEALFDRHWALTLLAQALADLRAEFEQTGQAERFDVLKSTLTASAERVPYAELASRLELSEGAVQVAVHRLRARYRECIRARIAPTVDNPAAVDDELRDLFRALSAS